jgi:hypothetical protein
VKNSLLWRLSPIKRKADKVRAAVESENASIVHEQSRAKMNAEHIKLVAATLAEKSGGFGKMKDLLKSVLAVAPEKRVSFVRRSVKTEAGANEILALVLVALYVIDDVGSNDVPRGN